MISCKKESTRWETDWSAPLINDTLDLSNMINDSTLDASGAYYYLDLERTLLNIDVNELIKIEDTTITETFTIAVANLTLAPGFNFVNSSEVHDLNIPDVQLKKVILQKGFIDVTVKNPIGTKAFFDVKLPGASIGGVTFDQEFVAPAGTNANPGVITQTIDLSGYTLDLSGPFGSEFNKLISQVDVATDPSGPAVNITNQDVTIVEASFRDVKLAYGRGYFGNRIISDTTIFDFDALNIYGSGLFDLPAASVTFELENGIKVGAEGNLHLVSNKNSAGNVIELSGSQLGTSFDVDPATGWWSNLAPSFKSLVFNNGNSNIESFLENLGYNYQVGYSIQLNPWGNVSGGYDEFFPSSKLRVKLKVQMPMTIGMDELVLKDTFDVNLNQDPEKTHVKSGSILLSTSNAFPFSADIKLFLLDANNNVLHTISGSEQIESSEYGTMDPSVNLKVRKNEISFVLSEAAANDANLIKKIVVQSRFNSPNGLTGVNEPQPIPVGAFLGIKLKTKFITENIF